MAKTHVFEEDCFKAIPNEDAKEFVKGLLNERFLQDKDTGGRWNADDAINCKWIQSIFMDL
jgi:hypothetical protein